MCTPGPYLLVKGVSMLHGLLMHLVILLLLPLLLLQLHLSFCVGSYSEALGLRVELGQLFEVSLGQAELGSESILDLQKDFDLFQGVAGH